MAGRDSISAMTAIQHRYAYNAPSRLQHLPTGQVLLLASETQPEANTLYLRARSRFPFITARGLRAVSDIVGSRFYVPPAMLARILREADPVVTVCRQAVRFEGFSACCSSYARLDLDAEALDIEDRRNGTTNVDFGPELRAALAGVTKSCTLDISVGSQSVTIARCGDEFVEKKVALPIRWIKGFAEVQIVMAGMERALSVDRIPAQRFLRQLPRSDANHLQWVTVAGSNLRLSTRESSQAVPLCGAHRLRVLEALAPMANAMNVYINRSTGASAWILDFGSQRLSLALNAEPWRGFSGDGGLLEQLAGLPRQGLAAIRAQLDWQDLIDEGGLAKTTGLPVDAVRAGLAELAAGGMVGYDLHRAGYFHRVLPFDLGKLEALNPRLKAARALVASGAVVHVDGVGEIASGNTTHRVRANDSSWYCTCPWYAKHQGRRGPCKHILALEIFLDRQP